ncbi:MAG: carotenoid 1,2-hydratase [Verrucomicrobiota bacterium]
MIGSTITKGLFSACCAVLVAFWAALPVEIFGDWIEPPLQTEEGYPVPRPNTRPEIPSAHGAHREYAIEWWYWVGHLESVDGEERFGFQSTVFRLAGDSKRAGLKDEAVFGDRQLYMSHAALSELSKGNYLHHERIYREGWQASSATGSLDLKVGMIEASELPDEDGFSMRIHYENGSLLDLKMRPEKPLVAFGDRGLSRKGVDPVAVSLYWTYTRLSVEGTLTRNGKVTPVQGISWMDHEISSSQLGSDLEGWDWTAIQLDDGTEVKAYRLRKNDGGSDPWSAVYWIDADSKVHRVYAKDFRWIEEAFWESPETGLRYPTSVRIEAIHPDTLEKMIYILSPMLENQEFTGNDGSNAYWEGACEVFDAKGKRIGLAYLELAGYGGGLGARLD